MTLRLLLILTLLCTTTGCRGYYANKGADGCMPDDMPPPPGDEAPPADLPPAVDPADDLEGTVWTSALEGSLGTYVTWFSLEPSELAVTQERQNGYEPDNGVLWTGTGEWQRPSRGLVRLAWEEQYTWDDSVAVHERLWTYAPLTPPLATQLFDEWSLQWGHPWSDSAVLASDQSHSHFYGEWRHDSAYPGGYVGNRWKSVELTFDNTPSAGTPCRVTATISVGEEDETNPATTATDTFTWTCSVTEDTSTGLTRIDIADFAGDDSEARAAWRASVAGRYPSSLQNDFQEAFIPRLWMDPDRADVLAWRGSWAPLVSRSEEEPPS